jgi:hypothetical protein
MTQDDDRKDKEDHNDHGHGHGQHGGREPPWRLNVQGVPIESRKPEISVRDAITLAGMDASAPWIIVLKTSGGKKEVGLDYIIDLRLPGIEKLRLTPRQIDNGEGPTPVTRREFALLPQDEVLLQRRGVHWETVVDGGRRWLLIHGYPLPEGYQQRPTTFAIEVPISYPGSRLDMFYCNPPVNRLTGAPIPQTEHAETIFGTRFQRWSRHRQWDPTRDTLATHLALVDESLRREVE